MQKKYFAKELNLNVNNLKKSLVHCKRSIEENTKTNSLLPHYFMITNLLLTPLLLLKPSTNTLQLLYRWDIAKEITQLTQLTQLTLTWMSLTTILFLLLTLLMARIVFKCLTCQFL
jgi:hypothetical protein